MIDSLEIIVGRIDERTQAMQSDITEMKASIKDACQKSQINGEDIASLKAVTPVPSERRQAITSAAIGDK